MLKLLGLIVALPFIAIAMVLLVVLSPFAFVDGLGAVFGLLVAVVAFALVAGVLGVVGTVVAGVFGLVGTILGGVLGLLAPLLLGVLALVFVAALVPLLLPLALLAGLVWLIARAARPSPPSPPALPHATA